MKFEDALKALRNGKMIRRSEGWIEQYFLVVKNGEVLFFDNTDFYSPEYNKFSPEDNLSGEDLLAEDWEIVDDTNNAS